MARRAMEAADPLAEWPEGPIVQGEPLEPVRYVERVLTRPDGTQIVAQVPVYPPFRLQTWPPTPDEARHLGTPLRCGPASREAEGEPELELEELELEEDAA